jgi:AraC-like DNA-binding protein
MALSPIQGMSASQGRELAAAAILAGDARLSVDAFSRLINVPVRTLEWRTNRELGMSPRRLLAWAFVIHAAWRIEYLEETISSTASLGGFPSVSAFSNCFKRYAGFRPSAIIKQGGSADLVSVFRSRVFRRAHN